MPKGNKYLKNHLVSCLKQNGPIIAMESTSGISVSYNSLLEGPLVKDVMHELNSVSTGVVAIYSNKNLSFVELILATILSDHIYLPLDYYSPPERISCIIKDAEVKAVFVQKGICDRLIQQLECDGFEFYLKEFNPEYSIITFMRYRNYDSDVSHILYTSGSTGKPKGVIHTHTSTLTFINWCVSKFSYPKYSKFLSVAPFSFDLSIMDIFVCFTLGGTLVIPSNEEVVNSRLMAKYIEDCNINVIYSTPSFFNLLLQFGRIEKYNFSSVRMVFFAGEQLFFKLVSDMGATFIKAHFYNLYGPTETNVCFYFKIDMDCIDKNQIVPIGQPCDFCKVYIEKLQEGNLLYVSGNNLMKGYVGITDVFKEIGSEKYYNTGDLITLNKNRDWVFKSRVDNMIKRNGFRIELMEIEQCYRNYKAITKLAVISTDKNIEKQIALVYTSKDDISELELRNFGLQKLPSYMIPDIFKKVEEIEINSNGKIDYKKLAFKL